MGFVKVALFAVAAAGSQDSDECARCTAPQSQCCVQGGDRFAWKNATRCIDPSIDVCVGGHVCPIEQPEVCMADYNNLEAPGDFWCYNATTHACMDKWRYCDHCGHVVCPIGSTPCNGSCMPDGEGFCCGNWPHAKWYRND